MKIIILVLDIEFHGSTSYILEKLHNFDNQLFEGRGFISTYEASKQNLTHQSLHLVQKAIYI